MKILHQAIIVQLKNLYLLDANATMENLDEAFEDVMDEIAKESDPIAEVISKISCNALYGFTSSQTMKVQGYFKG